MNLTGLTVAGFLTGVQQILQSRGELMFSIFDLSGLSFEHWALAIGLFGLSATVVFLWDRWVKSR